MPASGLPPSFVARTAEFGNGISRLDKHWEETEPVRYAQGCVRNGPPAKVVQIEKAGGAKKRGGGPGRPASSDPLSGMSGQPDGGRPAGRVLAYLFIPVERKKFR